jgi:hypothetical protein
MLIPLADELIRVTESACEKLRRFNDAEAALKPAIGKWSKKQIVGHLIDSATNNLHRFVRAQEVVGEFAFPKYEQEHWIASQGYNESSWTELIEFWRLCNRHLSRVIERIPVQKLDVMCRIGEYEPVTLRFLVEDYLVHMKDHLNQMEEM